ncbi:MAG TPA: hypothetical protein ENN24_06275 [Bacteroidetes bacterium]|nr:hypothetical protein [Bacteroidota bacterium]
MANPFTKNDPRINRKGRPKGSPNKTVEELRSAIKHFIDDNLETLQADFDKLEPKDRLAFVERLLKHVLPPMVTSLEQLSEADLDILLNKLKNETVNV